jgi:Family of unknown function (DUF6527)
MPKLMPIEKQGQVIGYCFDCPGCKLSHTITVRPYRTENGASWEFSGDMESPTFQPSVSDRWEFNVETGKRPIVCHFFVTGGQIQFLDDCTHSFAGQTVPMLERKATKEAPPITLTDKPMDTF